MSGAHQVAVAGLLIVCGLQREARIAGGRTVVGGGDSEKLAQAIAAAVSEAPVSAILSFGVAGALSPKLRLGQVVVPQAVAAPDGARFMMDAGWRAKLLGVTGAVPVETLAGADAVIVTLADKRALHRAAGADAVDMESHVAALAAQRLGAPFAVVRAVSDQADHPLPPAAVVGMRADGGVDVIAVLAALAADPRQLPGLIRMGVGAGAAFAALRRFRAASGERLQA